MTNHFVYVCQVCGRLARCEQYGSEQPVIACEDCGSAPTDYLRVAQQVFEEIRFEYRDSDLFYKPNKRE